MTPELPVKTCPRCNGQTPTLYNFVSRKPNAVNDQPSSEHDVDVQVLCDKCWDYLDFDYQMQYGGRNILTKGESATLLAIIAIIAGVFIFILSKILS